jgi:hydroxypyruvate isomerase
MQLTACIEWLFADETDDLSERILKANDYGLKGVEFHLWRDKPIDKIASALRETGTTLTSFCVDPRRSIVNESELDEFLAAVKDSIAIAKKLNCKQLIIASGFMMEGISYEDHFDLALRALKPAAAMAEEAGITLLLEPLNDKVDHPGMYLCSVEVGLRLVEAVNSPGLKLIYDAYHSIVMGDNIETILTGRMQHVAHIQVADMPGRGSPGTGSVNWSNVINAIKKEGYDGWIGLEYKINDQSTRQSLDLTKKSLNI